jgi:hypothetical protein
MATIPPGPMMLHVASRTLSSNGNSNQKPPPAPTFADLTPA